MIKVAFCDDEPVILEQITALLEKYKEQRCRDMEYAAFRSPLELLVEMENGLHPDVLLLDDHARRERHQRRTGDTAV